jgi:hypothetical protein
MKEVFMSAAEIIHYVDIGLYAIAGIAGLIVLFRNTTFAWKWLALAAIIWGLTSLFMQFVPSLPVKVLSVVQRLGMGLCLSVGLITYK